MPVRLRAGVDIGGTNQSVVVAGDDGAVLGRYRRRTPPGGAARDVLDNVRAMLREGVAVAGGSLAGSVHLAAIGVGFGGPVDLQRGVVIDSHHVPGWTDFPLRQTLEQELGAPVTVENDANAGALGEAVYGAGKGHALVLYVNVGTGIGGGIVLDGRVLHGRNGLAGEIGHVTVVPGGPECACGKHGCLEAIASGPSIARLAREWVAERDGMGGAILRLAGGDVRAVTSSHVFRAAADGDSDAVALVQRVAGAIGLALGNAANLLDPSIMVIGGGVASVGDLLLQPVRTAMAQHLLPTLPAPPVVPAALGYDAGAMGALAMSFQIGNGG